MAKKIVVSKPLVRFSKPRKLNENSRVVTIALPPSHGTATTTGHGSSSGSTGNPHPS